MEKWFLSRTRTSLMRREGREGEQKPFGALGWSMFDLSSVVMCISSHEENEENGS